MDVYTWDCLTCVGLEGDERGNSMKKATNVFSDMQRTEEKTKTRTWEAYKQVNETW